MAFFNRTEVSLKDTTTRANVPNDPRARLMYYLDCMCTVLKLNDDDDINRLKQYQNYRRLSRQDRDLLLQLCILLKPDVLLDKCIFQNDSLCGDMGNKFYDLETVRNSMFVAGNVLVGGRNRQVTDIMTFTMSWLNKNWTVPMQSLIQSQRREREQLMRQQDPSGACIIL